ncbi:hypothetical protein NG799_14060 [Laspinema sp. D1]|uniref:Uncharacterized protein n=1 Tax=Laspinema palackyanum D2a TaxID=2953684 RepID=A0ABT2MVE3_9CYAN|nr:hypothetical protein [Laspinema sp. D2a]
MIEIPPEYQQNIQERRDVKVIIVSEEKDKPRLMDQLAEKPISVQDWVKPSREEIHERQS